MLRGGTVTYNPATLRLSCDAIAKSLPPVNGVAELRLLVDRTSVAIVRTDGRLYMPPRASYPATNWTLSLTAQGGSATFHSLQIYKLTSAWPPF